MISSVLQGDIFLFFFGMGEQSDGTPSSISVDGFRGLFVLEFTLPLASVASFLGRGFLSFLMVMAGSSGVGELETPLTSGVPGVLTPLPFSHASSRNCKGELVRVVLEFLISFFLWFFSWLDCGPSVTATEARLEGVEGDFLFLGRAMLLDDRPFFSLSSGDKREEEATEPLRFSCELAKEEEDFFVPRLDPAFVDSFKLIRERGGGQVETAFISSSMKCWWFSDSMYSFTRG